MSDVTPTSNVTLAVDGLIYGGWKSVSVRQSIETISGTFSLSISERWPGQQPLKAILAGMADIPPSAAKNIAIQDLKQLIPMVMDFFGGSLAIGES